MKELVLYEVWCKTDYQTFFALPANCDIIDVGLLLDPKRDMDEIQGIGEQLLAERMGWA